MRRGAVVLRVASLALLIAAGLESSAAAGSLTARFAGLGLIKPLDRPGQPLDEAVRIEHREALPLKFGQCWHFSGTSRLTGLPVVGVEQRWRLPASLKLTPAQVIETIWRGGTVGADGEGPRFAILKMRIGNGWRSAAPTDSILADNFRGALVRLDNMRPTEFSALYNRMGGRLIVDADRVFKSDDRAEFQVLGINPKRRLSGFPGSQFATMRIGARRVPGGGLEVYKEYMTQRPEELVAVGAPVVKPVSALLSAWNALPACLRNCTPMGIATQVGARIGTTMIDAALGPQLREIVLRRHSHLFDETFFPALRSALEKQGR